MSRSLPSVLRRCWRLLESLESGINSPEAVRARDLLQRDLLPRTAGRRPYLVAGIVGPANAGKSALFNRLVGRALSPSDPVGGRTRRLIGAAHPELLEQLRLEPTLRRFPLEVGEDLSESSAAAAQSPVDPAELLAVPLPELPPDLLLIDTPDFDSVVLENRDASESLLAVADLAVVVVTRHSYQNREVVRFLQGWLDRGRPWILVYNESVDPERDLENAAKLVRDLGSYPLAIYRGVLDPAAPLGEALTEIGADWLEREDPTRSRGRWRAGELGACLLELATSRSADREDLAELKSRALAASLNHLRDALEALAAELASHADRARELLDAATACCREPGRRIAAGAMPLAPLHDAMRRAPTERSLASLRGWRRWARQAGLAWRRVAFGIAAPAESRRLPDGGALRGALREQLEKNWPDSWSMLGRELGRTGRHPARETCSVRQAEMLDRDLASLRSPKALKRAASELGMSESCLERFQASCDELAQAALADPAAAQMAFDLAVQARAPEIDHFFVRAGAFGAALCALTPDQVDPFLAAQLRALLKLPFAEHARESWARVHGDRCAEVVLDAALESTAPQLRLIQARERRVAEELRNLGNAIGEKLPGAGAGAEAAVIAGGAAGLSAAGTAGPGSSPAPAA